MRDLCCRCVAAVFVLLSVSTAFAETPPVSGVVTGAKGMPVAGCRVGAVRLALSPDGAKPVVEATGETSSSGVYSLASPPSSEPESIRFLVAWKPGKCLGWSLLSLPASVPDAKTSTNIVTHALVRSSGKVVDTRSKPLAGAAVDVLGYYPYRALGLDSLPVCILSALGIAPSAHTGSDGRYTLEGVPSGIEVRVSVMKAGMGPADPCPMMAGSTIVMAPATAIVTGLVVDADGKVCPGVAVTLSGPMVQRVTTGTDGRYRATGVVAGVYKAAAGYDRSPSFTVKPGRETPAPAVRISRRVRIEGKAVDESSGQPVAGIVLRYWVDNESGSYPPGRSTKTLADGGFCADVPVAKICLEVIGTAGGYQLSPGSSEVTVPREGLKGLVLKMAKAQEARCRVLDGRGLPAAGYSVTLEDSPDEASVTCGADGSVSLMLPPPGMVYGPIPADEDTFDVRAVSPDGRSGCVAGVSRKDLLSGTCVIRTGPVADLQITVKLPGGSPAAFAKVYLTKVMRLGNGSTSETSYSRDNKSCDATGHAVFKGLLPGAGYRVTAAKRGFYDAGARTVFVPGKGKGTVDVRLVRAVREQRGRVVDENGKPLVGMTVTVVGGSGISAAEVTHAVTDRSGRFILKGLPDSRVHLTVYHSGRFADVTVNKNTGPVTIQLFPPEGRDGMR